MKHQSSFREKFDKERIGKALQLVEILNSVEESILEDAHVQEFLEQESIKSTDEQPNSASYAKELCAYSDNCFEILQDLVRSRQQTSNLFSPEPEVASSAGLSQYLHSVSKRGRGISVDQPLKAMLDHRYSTQEERKAASLSKLKMLG